MPFVANLRPSQSVRVAPRPLSATRARNVTMRASPPDTKPKGIKQYLKDAVKGVFQTELAKDLQWRSNEYSGKISHDDHARLRKLHSVVKQAKTNIKENKPLPALPAPADVEPPQTLKSYIVGAIESVFASKDVDLHEPKWHEMPYSGDIAHSSHELNRLKHTQPTTGKHPLNLGWRKAKRHHH